MLFIVGAVLVIGAIAVGAVFLLSGGGGAPSEPMAEDGTATPEVPKVQIVVAAQNLARGVQITEEMNAGDSPAVILKSWPEEEVPAGALTRLEDVYGRTTRQDIVRDLPILASMLVDEPFGSAAALQIPEGMVAYALPVSRYSSIAWALQPGDYVDMMISLLITDLDEEFQSALPLRASCISPPEGEECKSGLMGRLEVLPNGWLVNLVPNGAMRSQLVTQLTLQNVLVLRVGDWPTTDEPPPDAMEDPDLAAEEPPPEEGAMPEIPEKAPLTLAVTRQDAMILEYVQLTGARVTFLLRRTGDDSRVTTESITLQYLMERFNVEIPPKLPYGIDSEINTLRDFGEETSPTGGE
jgi:pilus assembly protein CpaB